MDNNKITNYLLVLFLILVSFSVYVNSLWGDFLIDDYAAILKNTEIHDIKKFFTQRFDLKPGILTDLVHVFIWQKAFGRPFLFHLFNVLVHGINVVLLFLLLNIIFHKQNLSFLTSLIFAIHPIHTEAVSWISGGPYALGSLFFLAAFIFYVKSDKSLVNLGLSVLFFGLCLFTNNVVVVLPIMFLIYDLFFRERTKEIDLFLYRFRIAVLLLIIFISALVAGIFFLGRNKFIHTIYFFRGPSYLIVIAKALVYYLKILYLPLQRGLYHPFAYNTVDTGKITPAFFVSLIVILGSVFLFFRCLKKEKAISFGIAWFFISYLPYSNLVPICNIISERYMYLASVGFCLILSAFFLKVWEIINQSIRYRQILRILAMVIIILFLSSYAILTIMHNRDYKDLITYWETNIENFPDGYMAYNNLAGIYYMMGKPDQAIAYCWVNLMINPKQPHVWCNLGKVYHEKGDLKWAKYCYEQALKIDKNFLPAVEAMAEIEKIDKMEN